MGRESRLVLLEPREVDRQLGFTTQQTAIPWCTTHNQPPVFYDELAGAICHPDSRNCNVSKGGPDHKWWKDE